MIVPLTRRHFITATLSASILPRLAWAQSTPVIDGRTFPGTRTVTGTAGEGGEGIRAKTAMTLRNCRFLNLGNGCVRVNVSTNNLVIEDCEAENVYRFLEDTSSSNANPAVLSNFALRRTTAREVDHSMTRIRYGSHDGTIEDVKAYGSTQCDAYCVGYQLDNEAHNITYNRVEAHHFQESGTAASKYWNGDGFSDERGNHDIRYLTCTATECTDGGFDLKSTDVYMENCVSRANKRNYRLWSSGELHGCRSEDPHHYGGSGGAAHFSFHGDAGTYILDRPVVRAAADNKAPVFLIETTAPLTLEIHNADIDAAGAPLIAINGPQPTIRWIPERPQQNIRILRDLA